MFFQGIFKSFLKKVTGSSLYFYFYCINFFRIYKRKGANSNVLLFSKRWIKYD